jgi:hypothetical protein
VLAQQGHHLVADACSVRFDWGHGRLAPSFSK